ETKPVLHLLNLETSQDVEVPNGSGGTFSPDSKWIAYAVDPNPGGRGGRGRGAGSTTPPGGTPSTGSGQAPRGGQPGEAVTTPPTGGAQQGPSTGSGQGRGAATTPPPPPRRVELRNLASGTVQSWQEIQSYTFNATSSHLILKRRPPQPAGAANG